MEMESDGVCVVDLLYSVSSCSIADAVPIKQAESSIVPTAEATLSPARPLRMLHCTSVTVKKKKKEQPAWRKPISPNRPKRTIEHLLTSPLLSQEPR